MGGRQFLFERADLQPESLQKAGLGTIGFTSSSITGAAGGVAASFSLINGNNQTSVVSTAVAVPPSVFVVDGSGLPVSGTSVSFIQLSSNSGVVTGAQQTTNASGIATAGSWSMGTQVGTQRMEVKAGSLSTQTFSATAIAGSAFSISPSGGTSQTTHVGGILPSRLTVLVEDNWRNPVTLIPVTWTSTDPDSTFFESVTTTAAAGTSGTTYQVGIDVLNSVASLYANISSLTSAVFAATSTVSAAAQITIILGDGQVGEVSTALPVNPQVEIDDAFGNPISGSQVTWVAGAGSLSTARTPTSSTGTAGTVWTLGSSAGTQLLTARGDFLSGSTVTFTVSASTPPPVLMALFGGNNQSGLVGATLASRLTVRFTTASSKSAVGANANWVSSDGTLSAADVVSDADGYSGVAFSLGTTARTSIITATCSGVTGSPVTFAVSALTNQASSLTFAVQPSSNVADATVFPQQPQAQIIDLYGNSCLSNAVSVSIQTNTATGAVALSGTTNITTNAVGRAVWTNLQVSGAGQGFTLNATSSGLTAKQSNTVNVAPPVGSKLAFTVQPGSITAGNTFNPTVVVAVQDSTGNTVPGATDPVQLTISGAGALTGTTLRSAVAGLATFTSLGESATGTFTITATSGTLTLAVSASFTASSSGAAHPNEPAATTLVTERNFAAVTEASWTNTAVANLAIVTSDGAGGTTVDTMASQFPRSTEATGRAKFQSVAKGTGPINTARAITAGSRGVYIDFDFGISSGWVYNPVVNKILFLCAGGSSAAPCVICLSANGKLQTRTQNTADSPNAINYDTGPVLTKGQKYRIEVVYYMNTNGVADGLIQVWIDGVAQTVSNAGSPGDGRNGTNAKFRGTGAGIGATDTWTLVKWNPTYGGQTGDSPSTPQYMYIGYLYVSRFA